VPGNLSRSYRKEGDTHGIATSGRQPEIDASLDVLGVPPDMTVVERSVVLRAKPEPDLFLACQERLGVEIRDSYVVGDAVWDLLAARRAGMLSVGLLTGGYGEDELLSAGALRVYRGADELLDAIHELGILPGAARGRERPTASPIPQGDNWLRCRLR
jgi:phosphoglycolate phosphatase-like HAD superfamily hydrolase